MRRRRIRFKRIKRRYKQKERGCKAAANCWRPHKHLEKEDLNIFIKRGGCKKLLLKIRKNKR